MKAGRADPIAKTTLKPSLEQGVLRGALAGLAGETEAASETAGLKVITMADGVRGGTFYAKPERPGPQQGRFPKQDWPRPVPPYPTPYH